MMRLWAGPELSKAPPKSEPCQDVPLPPQLPHHCSARGGTSQICWNNGLGRGQVPLRAQQRAGAATSLQDCKHPAHGGCAAT